MSGVTYLDSDFVPVFCLKALILAENFDDINSDFL